MNQTTILPNVATSKNARIFIAGHRGMVGSAIVRRLQSSGYSNLLTRTRQELDLLDQRATFDVLQVEKPDYIFIAAARVGGINANNTYRADFIYENLTVQNNIIHGALKAGVKDLCFLGSSCIYPRECPQGRPGPQAQGGKARQSCEERQGQGGEAAQAGGGQIPQCRDGGNLVRARQGAEVAGGTGGGRSQAGGVLGGVIVGR